MGAEDAMEFLSPAGLSCEVVVSGIDDVEDEVDELLEGVWRDFCSGRDEVFDKRDEGEGGLSVVGGCPDVLDSVDDGSVAFRFFGLDEMIEVIW
jgi:hypothetical protein